jgi:hypothetical protein
MDSQALGRLHRSRQTALDNMGEQEAVAVGRLALRRRPWTSYMTQHRRTHTAESEETSPHEKFKDLCRKVNRVTATQSATASRTAKFCLHPLNAWLHSLQG